MMEGGGPRVFSSLHDDFSARVAMHTDNVRVLLNHGADRCQRCIYAINIFTIKASSLRIAFNLKKGHPDTVRLLIEYICMHDVNAAMGRGWSAMVSASQNGHVDMHGKTACWLTMHAYIEPILHGIKSKTGYTALEYAVYTYVSHRRTAVIGPLHSALRSTEDWRKAKGRTKKKGENQAATADLGREIKAVEGFKETPRGKKTEERKN